VGAANARWIGLLTIDGPAGAGKTTAARAVAAISRSAVLDVGIWYREVARRVVEEQRRGASWEAAVAAILGDPTPPASHERLEHRSDSVERLVAAVAAERSVRDVVTAWQRTWRARHDSAIVVGRVGGLHVFPDADVKVYLTADEQVRRMRRGPHGANVQPRDTTDANRRAEPMQHGPDAVVIDTTALRPADVATRICQLLRVKSE
jgi:cytidylate kinase